MNFRLEQRPPGWAQTAPIQIHHECSPDRPTRQITFHIVQSSSPGLRVMAEDYQITPLGHGSRLAITLGLEAKGPLRRLPRLVRFLVGRATRGVRGITTVFP
jgi:hypothetical protein